MRISQLEIEYSQKDTADIELPVALLSIRGRDGAVPGGMEKASPDQMAAADLSEECTIFDIPECTVCRNHPFFSFRARGTDMRNFTWIKVKGL